MREGERERESEREREGKSEEPKQALTILSEDQEKKTKWHQGSQRVERNPATMVRNEHLSILT